MLQSVIVAAAHRTGTLARLMNLYACRKLIGDDQRVQAWRQLGMTNGRDVQVGPRVRDRRPENITIGDGSMIGGDSLLDGWGPLGIGRNCIFNDEIKLLGAATTSGAPTRGAAFRQVTLGGLRLAPAQDPGPAGRHDRELCGRRQRNDGDVRRRRVRHRRGQPGAQDR